MDSGWAVVLGAVIALIGSSVVPWIRESLAERSRAKRAQEERRRTAMIDVIETTSAGAAALIMDDDPAFLAAYSARTAAVTRLMLECDEADRRHLWKVNTRAAGKSRRNAPEAARAFHLVMVDWYAGTVPADKLLERFDEELREAERLRSGGSH
ncbi:hypothetical protein [Microbacterium sp. SGAir0570]|uniref:hypothetical protein n=1 Tax=Microbacterium sp. SGAir0570 TaxID=2070348 RepID=UPI0010F48861|nr:hypothetical protein [Microbacterium sp. SGAir0570]